MTPRDVRRGQVYRRGGELWHVVDVVADGGMAVIQEVPRRLSIGVITLAEGREGHELVSDVEVEQDAPIDTRQRSAG